MRIVVTLLVLCLAPGALAHDGESEVVPDAERDRAQEREMTGPTENEGVSAIDKLGRVDLAGEIENPDERTLRVREITIDPGGVIAVHQHHGRPGMAYVLEGEIVEHRGQPPEAIEHGVGSVAFERTGVTHWWENRSDSRVRALVVDIVPAE